MKHFMSDYKNQKTPYAVRCENLDTYVLIFDAEELQWLLRTERPVLREINQSYKLKVPGLKDAKPHFNDLYNKIA